MWACPFAAGEAEQAVLYLENYCKPDEVTQGLQSFEEAASTDELIPELPASDYTSLWHRFRDLEFKIPESEDKVVVAVDATGVKVTDHGEWLRKHHKGKRRHHH